MIGVDGLNIIVKQSSSIYNVKSDEAVTVGEEFWSIPAPLKAEKKKRVMEEATVEVQQYQSVRPEISEGLNEVREESTVAVGQDKSGNNQLEDEECSIRDTAEEEQTVKDSEKVRKNLKLEIQMENHEWWKDTV